MNAMECSYTSIFDMLFGDKPYSEAVCDLVHCKVEPKCSSIAVPIKVRHCGEYYVYHLEALPEFNKTIFANYQPGNLKNGVYCGVKNETLPNPSRTFLISSPFFYVFSNTVESL